jgi:hypothetical protein
MIESTVSRECILLDSSIDSYRYTHFVCIISDLLFTTDCIYEPIENEIMLDNIFDIVPKTAIYLMVMYLSRMIMAVFEYSSVKFISK